jgi:hypothetical protein
MSNECTNYNWSVRILGAHALRCAPISTPFASLEDLVISKKLVRLVAPAFQGHTHEGRIILNHNMHILEVSTATGPGFVGTPGLKGLITKT